MPTVVIFIQALQDRTGPHLDLLREAGLTLRFPPSRISPTSRKPSRCCKASRRPSPAESLTAGG